MIEFTALGVLLVVLVLAVLFLPLMRRGQLPDVSRTQTNTTIYLQHKSQLDAELAQGAVSTEQHAQAWEELQQRLLADAQGHSATQTWHAPRQTMVLIGVGLPLLVLALYMYLGQPQAIGIQPGVASGQEQAMTSDEVTQMVSGLAAKLAQNPDNPAGWAMLVRSYKALGQLQEAEAAYDRALPYIANDPQMLADYADVSAANAQGKFTGKPERLIAKALSLDAKHPLALWLAGTAAFEAANYPIAVQHWERLLAQLPPDSEDAKVISQTLARVKAKLNTSPRIRQD